MKLNLRALAAAMAILWGGAVLVVGLANTIWAGYGSAFLNVLASVYPGYQANGSLADLVVGTLYALVDGLLGSLIFGGLYNYLAGRAKAPLP